MKKIKIFLKKKKYSFDDFLKNHWKKETLRPNKKQKLVLNIQNQCCPSIQFELGHKSRGQIKKLLINLRNKELRKNILNQLKIIDLKEKYISIKEVEKDPLIVAIWEEKNERKRIKTSKTYYINSYGGHGCEFHTSVEKITNYIIICKFLGLE